MKTVLILLVIVLILLIVAVFVVRRKTETIKEQQSVISNQADSPVPHASTVEDIVTPTIVNSEPVFETEIISTPANSNPFETITLTATKVEEFIPEDSVLRRHYLSQLEAEKLAISNPYPTDFTLLRHYRNLHGDLSVAITSTEPTVETQNSTIDLTATSNSTQTSPTEPALLIPEDSTLRRHYEQLLATR